MTPSSQYSEVSITARVAWGDVSGLPVLAATHFAAQTSLEQDSKDLVFTVGNLSAPVFIGSVEEQQQWAASLKEVTIQPLARFRIPRERAAELAELLQHFLGRGGAES